MSQITIKGICPRCQRDWEVTVDEANYQSFKKGDILAQEAFPELSPAERELLITGFCDDCWNDIFPPEDEDDENFGADFDIDKYRIDNIEDLLK